MSGTRITLLLPDLRAGGAERVSVELAREFARTGHRPEFLLLRARGELLGEARRIGPVRGLDTARLRAAPLALSREFRARPPEALLAAMWPLTGIAGLALRLAGSRAPFAASEHTDLRGAPAIGAAERRLAPWIAPHLYARARRVIAVSGGVARSVHEVMGVPLERIEVIHNPLRRPSPEEGAPPPEAWMAGAPRLVAIGSLKPQKGFADLIDAFALVAREAPRARLLILGEGPLRAELEARRDALGLADRIAMPGFHAAPEHALRRADLFVLSSHLEGFGNVLIEALDCGLPVVATDCPSGPAEIVDSPEIGLLAPPRDPAALARTILDALSRDWDPRAARRRAAAFDPARIAALYLGALGLGSGAPAMRAAS